MKRTIGPNPMKTRMLTLSNEQGNVLDVVIRPYRQGDEQTMLACIWEEYQNTYFKKDFYNPSFFLQQEQEERIRFFVAESRKDGIVGMMLIKQFTPQETMCEIASQIFRKKYRGYRLSMPFFEYALDIIKHDDYSSVYCLPVLFHDITQRSMKKLGFHATGVILNVFDVDHITHSYENGRNHKHSQGIQVKALVKKDAGTIFIPTKHRKFVGELYKNLGVNCQISDSKPGIMEMYGKMPGKSVISYKHDREQQNLEIRIHKAGLDLEQQIRDMHDTFPLKGKQTAGIFLNCTDSNAVWAYEILRKFGYFFTGMRPIGSENEYMVLHNSGDVKIIFEDYHVNEEFAGLLDYVKICYAER